MRQSIINYVIIVSCLFFSFACIGTDRNKVGIFDMSYTLETDLSTEAGVNTAWDDVHTVSTLQGVVNRTVPQLYLLLVKEGNHDIDRYWWDKYRKEGEWLAGKDTICYRTMEELVVAYRPFIKGVVVYDENVASTSNVASAIAGIENLIAIRFDPRPGSLYSRLVLDGPKLKVKKWLVNTDGSPLFTGKDCIPGTNRASTGSIKNDPYIWFIEHYMKKGKCNTEYAAYYIDQYWKTKSTLIEIRNHHTLTNHDFFVSKQAFFFDLSPWGDEPATDDLKQPMGTDFETLKEMLLLAYKQNDNGKRFTYIGGFPPWIYKYTDYAKGKHEAVATEWEYSRIISAYNAFKDADALGFGALANASFWQHYPLKESYPQKWVTHEELQEKGYLDKEGKLSIGNKKFLIFYVGDYDASSWLSTTTPTLWDDPARGKVPMMWSISPVLEKRVPMAWEYRVKTATDNDYFVAADNGAGYLMPGMLQEPRPISGLPDAVEDWRRHNIPYYNKWGLTVTGFVIDGHAPPMNDKSLDAYASFSPNGIVPQKVPMAMIHGNMPVLREGGYVMEENPAEAAQTAVDLIEKNPIPFYWIRNVLKSPRWYVDVAEEMAKIDPNIVLLDAPSFFELSRVYLKEQNDIHP